MTIDRHLARQAFNDYVRNYDPDNPRIALKIDHTIRVADLCARIADAEGLDADLAWLCGLLHDVGRFEQVRRFDTFNDALSVSHAALGAQILFGDDDPRGPQIRAYVTDDEEDDLLRTAVATHSAYRLPHELDDRTRAYCNILRDADKVDIIKVNCICPVRDIYGVTEDEMVTSTLTPSVVEAFFEHRTVPRGTRKTPADILVSHICFAWELVYPTSRDAIQEQGYLEQMLNRQFREPQTQATFETMGSHMRQELFHT